jgi:predicted nucleic acid-binding protein
LATYLLDTSIIIDVLNGKRGRRDFLLHLVTEGHVLACCPINVSEIYAGMRPAEADATEGFLRSLDWYQITWEAAQLAGLLKRDYQHKGITLSLADTTIAAVALTNGLTLVTANAKDFPMEDLVLCPLSAG